MNTCFDPGSVLIFTMAWGRFNHNEIVFIVSSKFVGPGDEFDMLIMEVIREDGRHAHIETCAHGIIFEKHGDIKC